MEKPEKSISIAYERSPNRVTIAATGAFGGPSPNAQNVVAHLFVEHGSVPIVVTHTVTDEGAVSPQPVDVTTRANATREIVATLVLSPEAAIIIGEWLKINGVKAIQARGGFEIDDNP